MNEVDSKLREAGVSTQEAIELGKKNAKEAIEESTTVPTLRKLICDKMGYPLEKHIYITKDGYINSVYRIPGPKGTKEGVGAENKPVVIYNHGLTDCCASIIADTEDSLGIRLVNEGYDLWMNNNRGNRYSRDHQWLNPNKLEYWNFSFDQFAKYD